MPKKLRTGAIVAAHNTNTVTIAVERMKMHPLYRKQYRVTKKYHADTAGQTYAIGDVVTIEETRPISKSKHWKVVGKATEGTV